MTPDEIQTAIDALETLVTKTGIPGQDTDLLRRYVLEQRLALNRRITSDPLTRRYARTVGIAGFRNTEPWTALAERSGAAKLLAEADTPEYPYIRLEHSRDWPGTGVVASQLAMAATPYLWHTSIDDIALAAPLPKHIIAPDVAPFPLMFWSLEDAKLVASGGEHNWMLVAQGSRGLVVAYDIQTESYDLFLRHIPYGVRWPSGFPGEAREPIATILKRCAFLYAPFVDADPVRLSRPIRRELKRAGLVDDETVAVVRLRHPVRDPSNDSEKRSINRKHSWWVSGHYRAQWYPSLQAHKIIFIAPHLKGKGPLLEKVYEVVR